MSGICASRRFLAVLAALLLLLAVPLGAPAVADAGHVSVTVVLDSPELLANVNDGSSTSIDTDVTFEVFSAGDGAPVLQSTQTASSGVGSASFDLNDGSYKIRVTAPGFLESWYTASSGSTGEAFLALLRYQERDTFESADAIVVDSVYPGNSSWSSEGWTVLHRSESSITGAVGNDGSPSQGSMLANVAVELYDEAVTDPSAGPVAETRTEKNGYYTFEDLAPGSYKVRFLAGDAQRWWPETQNRAEAEAITLNGASHFNLAYAVFPAGQAAADPAYFLTLTGEPALGATLTATLNSVEASPAGGNCLERYSWFINGTRVEGAFGSTFVVPRDAGGKSVHARLNTAGIGCTYRELDSSAIGPVDPGLTLPGENIVVIPEDSSGATNVTLTFENVTTPGTTTVTRLESGSAFPDGGFSSLTDPPLYYDITTTAGYDPALGAEVCITFDTAGMTEAQAAGQHLYHYVGGAWVDTTVSSSTGKVCGVTHSFSPFAVGHPRWPFRGFLQPVDEDGILNAMKAGAAVPIKFGLGGNRGLDIFAAEVPSSSAIACPGGPTPDVVEQTVAAEASSLRYSAESDTYTFVWKTQKTWAGSCRQFEMRLGDGTLHTALFDLRK